jgi:hypothetical protein
MAIITFLASAGRDESLEFLFLKNNRLSRQLVTSEKIPELVLFPI